MEPRNKNKMLTAVTAGGRPQQLKPPLSTALSEALHEGWKKLGIIARSPRYSAHTG
jgi:hypothetical protein